MALDQVVESVSRSEETDSGEQLKRLLRQLADVPRVVPPLDDFVELLVRLRIPRR